MQSIDINMGCPVNKVTRGGGGSALMCATSSTLELVRGVVEAVKIPVTVKMRLGWDDERITARSSPASSSRPAWPASPSTAGRASRASREA